jgi:acetyl-CoA carboxylase beta subunit
MAKCKNCKNLKYKDDGRERYAWCPIIGDSPDLEFERFCGAFKKMSNADRIRNMTDEELAEHFSGLIRDAEEHEYCQDTSDWLMWLKSEMGCE